METASKMAVLIDQRVTLSIGPLTVVCTVLDVRKVYGRVDALVTPLAGNGQQWVSCDRLRASLQTTDVLYHQAARSPRGWERIEATT